MQLVKIRSSFVLAKTRRGRQQQHRLSSAPQTAYPDALQVKTSVVSRYGDPKLHCRHIFKPASEVRRGLIVHSSAVPSCTYDSLGKGSLPLHPLVKGCVKAINNLTFLLSILYSYST